MQYFLFCFLTLGCMVNVENPVKQDVKIDTAASLRNIPKCDTVWNHTTHHYELDCPDIRPPKPF